MPVPKKYKKQLQDALNVLDRKTKQKIAPIRRIMKQLFWRTHDDLKAAIIGNPIEHHPIVLGHMLQIATSVKSPHIVLKQAAALALLHDIAAVPKITTQMVDDAEGNPGKGAALELERQENRVLHMRLGSGMAHRHLLALNKSQGQIVFDSRAIDNICEAIRIHDNPSLDIPIQRSNWLAVAFREADRLWMVTHEGILTDLARKHKNVKKAIERKSAKEFYTEFYKVYRALMKRKKEEMNEAARKEYRTQLEHNIERFFEERELYRSLEPTEGPFCDAVTFFRTAMGHKICLNLCDAAYDLLGTLPKDRLLTAQT